MENQDAVPATTNETPASILWRKACDRTVQTIIAIRQENREDFFARAAAGKLSHG
ncbi:MAG: hypothetical protein KGI37_02695 [Alphaproteobacteria bacterium]|nr:hypothetical protein [Alphaproteobacteria bacterium]